MPHAPESGTSSSDSFDHGRFPPGTLIGERYRIVARLGVGGMGEVYRADDLTLGQAVALKFLPEAVERDAGRLDKFTAEVRTARQIAHPNVCRVYDVGAVAPSTGSGPGRQFLSMEYVDGEDLQSLLRRIGRFPEDKGLEIARQICAGLAAMHDRGVLHRDLKPANIMIDGRGRVRLTDFGLATAVASSASSTGSGQTGSGQAAPAQVEIAGTPAYMAPEQFAGQPLTPATDLYALGLVLFELFTGERVQKGADAHAIRSAQFSVVQTLTTTGSGAKLDPLVQRVIERCLDPDPKRRPQSAVVIAAAMPGGDPLAAALAAGETPSPQMVAAAGETGGLSFKVAIPLLLLIMAYTVTEIGGALGRAESLPPFPYSPEVLASKAREMVERLGYTVTDSASGFTWEASSVAYSRWLAREQPELDPTEQIPGLRPAITRFWYRSSRTPLISNGFFGGVGIQAGGITITPDDPPLNEPGMTWVQLDPQGRLERLTAIPPTWSAADEDPVPPDWPAVFREAGLAFEQFSATEPEWADVTHSDSRAAWIGPGADPRGAPLRVEASAFRGRIVSFRLVPPWRTPPSANPPVPPRNLLAAVVLWLLTLGTLVGATLLAVRNIRRGRSDLRGATRLIVVVGAAALTAALLSSPFTVDQLQRGWIVLVSWAAFVALTVWLLYAAIEPYLRRGWPTMLVSWARLLEGRWRDPVIGRDLLIGGAAASLAGWLQYLRPDANYLSMHGAWIYPPLAIANRLSTSVWMVLASVAAVMLLVLVRIVVKSEKRAIVGVLVALLVFAAVSESLFRPPDISLVLLTWATSSAWALVALRFGLVANAGFFLLSYGESTLALPFGITAAVILQAGLGLLPYVFGFYTATRGRQELDWLDG